MELAVADAWSQILNVRNIGVHDNFYDLGGSSLLALEARMLLEQQLGYDVDVGLFEGLTLTEIAQQVRTSAGGPSEEEQIRFLEPGPA